MDITVIMKDSKYRIKYNEDNRDDYKILRGDVDVTEELRHDIVLDMLHHIQKLQDVIEDLSKEGLPKEEVFPFTRPETAIDNDLLCMLERVSSLMIERVKNAGISLQKDSVKIWIKRFNDKLYPKIEFDVDGQELQYDMNHNGTVNEVHFKTFVKKDDGVNGYSRKDVLKEEANDILVKIDNVLTG